MIVAEHVNIGHTAFEKSNLNHAFLFFFCLFLFFYIKIIDPNFLPINKKCIKNTNTVS